MSESNIFEHRFVPHTIEEAEKTVEHIIEMVKGYSPKSNTDMIYIAYRFAENAHRGVKRRSGEPYIIHPVMTGYIAASLNMDVVAISAALMHDVIEDTSYTFADIETMFGKNVAEIVDGVTKLTNLKYSSHEQQQMESLRKMFLAMAKDIRVVIIKLIDRLHNLHTLEYMTTEKQLEKAKETLDIYSPLAHRLGMSKVKTELEDLSLKYIDPVAYDEITKGIKQKREEREEYINKIIEVLETRLKEMGIKAGVTGRAKHFYSIFRKMYAQNKTLDEIYDLFAVRVIVDSVSDCYAVLGMVHEMYTPIPMRFKDYIATPKTNMYQSLHTTVIGPTGLPFEIQIRTWEMHKVAEEGIAAHWKYKEGISGVSDIDSKLAWVRQLLDNQQDIIDSDDFMKTIKFDIFNDEVFTFTPNGKVISLVSGSTVIDFAFAIHTQVGYKMSGAKVNGKIVTNNYELKNGDIVEILTSASVKGPSRDWLKIVKTSGAKNKINQWLKRECRDENIAHGKELMDKEIRRVNIPAAELMRQEWIEAICKKYTFSGIDDLYATIGYGGLSAQKVILRLRDEYLKDKKANKEEAEQNIELQPNRKNKTYKGIEVVGIENCLVRISGCCNPVPGDEIKGFITKGRGVSVHRADCSNIQESALSEEDRKRFIEVRWFKENDSSYTANIQVEAENRIGMLMNVGACLAELKIDCVAMESRVTKKGIAVMNFGLSITDAASVKRAMSKIKQIPGVIYVSRK